MYELSEQEVKLVLAALEAGNYSGQALIPYAALLVRLRNALNPPEMQIAIGDGVDG